MRMTRAQAAALAAVEAEANGAEPGAANDNNELDYDDTKNGSTTPTGEPQEREALAELRTNLHTSKESHDGPVDNQELEDGEIEAKTNEEQSNGEAQNRQQGDQQGPLTNYSSIETSTPTPSTSNNDKPNHISIHQDEALQPPQKDIDAGSPTTELPLLNITPQRTPAKNIIKNEFAHMRSTSNKENMVPAEGIVAGPVDRLQTHVELLGAGQEQQVQTSQQDEQPQPEQKTENHDHEANGEAQAGQHESSQAEEGQDDSLIDHFEALHVSPKKQKFNEQEVAPGAEQSLSEQPTLTSKSTDAQQAEKQTVNAAESHSDNSAKSQDKENKSPAPSTTKKASSASSKSETSKPVRKSSVRQSTLGRQSSVVRKSVAAPSRPEPSTSAAIKRTTSVKRSSVRPSMAPRAGSSQSTERGAPANIPHSKPRPMSMSFPTPPPPPKSSKAPTQSTFQLPGEAIAAKLKAEKEERLRRQAESGTTAKPTYKPPPPPKSTKAPTRSIFQLPGEAIAAKLKAEKEERQKRQEENGGVAQKPTYVPPAAPKSTKPVTKATFQLSSDAFAAKMKAQKEARLQKQKEEEKKEKERGVFKARPVPIMSKPAEVRQTNASRARLPSNENTAIKRASSVRDPTTAAQKRMSSFHPAASTSSTLPPRAVTSFQKRQSMAPSASKGKEVFGRAAEAKEKEEREKREKEEAAKKARAEAAEKNRQASREWAAKKKEKEERRRTNAATAAVV
ncbi:hypothetical protein E4T50_07043 [Aureobasidium sp. EXF-12298]|nr:hypothetical protein E4T50_07043 [Aureobasidium sp. EXF-12298]